MLKILQKSFLAKQEIFLRKTQIKHRLLFSFLLISILPLLIIASFSFVNSYSDVKDKMGFYLNQITREASINADMVIQNYESLCEEIVSSDQVQDDFRNVSEVNEFERFKIDDRLLKMLSIEMDKNDGIAGITLLNANGYYNVYVGYKLFSDNFVKQDIYKNAIDNPNQFFWYQPRQYLKYNKLASDKQNILCTTSIRGNWEGAMLGVLNLAISPDAFAGIFSGTEILQYGQTFIINSGGRYIYSKNSANLGTRFSDNFLVRKIYQNTYKKPRSFDYFLNGKKVLVSYSRLTNNDWCVVSLIPYSILMKKTDKIFTFALIILVIFIMAAIYCSFVVSYSISDPIQSLMDMVKKVEMGDYNVTIDQSGRDEIKELSVSYKNMIDEIDSLIHELYMAKIAQQDSQIKALKAQINPHFLYNTLENISSIAKVNKINEISEIAKNLSAMFRYSIKSGNDVVRLIDEIENVKSYLNILKIRFQDKLEIVLEIEDNVYNFQMYKFMLQPLVENAVHHGIEMKKGKGIVRLKAYQIENYLHLSVTDNGVGINPQLLMSIRQQLKNTDLLNHVNHGLGIGLANVNSRLAFYYHDDYQFNIDSEQNKGTFVEIIIPIKHFKEDLECIK
jgi:two-component system, sensor histidine kinase YesM